MERGGKGSDPGKRHVVLQCNQSPAVTIEECYLACTISKSFVECLCSRAFKVMFVMLLIEDVISLPRNVRWIGV